MSILDYSIIALYLAMMVGVGLYFQRKASDGIDAYFLGERKLPWWVLGASGMASNLDVSGTMINVAFIYALGTMGFFVELRGGIVLIMAFFMIFMGKWNRRAQVMTMAEWMEFRFGDGKQGKVARVIAALAVLTSAVAIVTYFAVGAGKFIGEFLGLPAILGFSPEFLAASLMIGLAMIYTVASGLFGVVWTDVVQGMLIFITILIICGIAIANFSVPEMFSVSVPLRDGGFLEIATNRSQWTQLLPDWQLDLPKNTAYSVYNLFGITIIFYLIKTIIEGSAGSGGYMAQRYFAARSDREAGLLSLFWTTLLAFRWPFIAAIALMGVAIGVEQGQPIADPEQVLPIVINQLVPIGLKGLLIAGLMAAFMSTFDSTVNAAASYWVRDIYQAFLNPLASEKQLLRHSRWASVIVVGAGLFLTSNVSSINDIWGWLTMSIGAGLFVPLLLRWYWWRMNGYGFAIGTLAGNLAAIAQRIWLPDVPEYWQFLLVSGIALFGTVAGSLATKPTDDAVLSHFFKTTRPFGFWRHIRENLPESQKISIRTENRRDIIAVCIAVLWQLSLFLMLMQIIFKQWHYFIYLFAIQIFLSTGLYFFWFRHLSDEIPTDFK
ncbi:MAG: sodium:solute symporter [Calditrichae bacterium]|nr:sodium:solute symporter [Calditrichia bacterium]